MLKINRLKVLIKTEKYNYSFDESFFDGVNFIASDDNTRGKSSVIIALYYALGLEEILGGTNEKVLTSVYKSAIEDADESFDVLESNIYLEVTGENDTVTLYRSAKHATRDARLVTVYFSKMDSIYDSGITSEDYYVNMPNAAKSQKGFHRFLEEFMGLELPSVPATDGVDRKLYLQLVFAAFFIEQKKGWASIYSGMPYLGIKDSKKRVTEYILGLNDFENNRNRLAVLNREKYLKDKWKDIYEDFLSVQRAAQCIVVNLSSVPELPDEEKTIHMYCSFETSLSVDEWISRIQEEQKQLITLKPKVIDNYDDIVEELSEIEGKIDNKSEEEKKLVAKIGRLKRKVHNMEDSLHVINQDIMNNKDARRLKELGSSHDYSCYEGLCPTCHQRITDSLLDFQQDANVMSIEETINHLNAQKDLVIFALENYRGTLEQAKVSLDNLRTEKITMLRLAKALRNDLYTVDEDYSETVIYKRMQLEHKIEELQNFKREADIFLSKFDTLRTEWKELLIEKEKLPKAGMSEEDRTRLKVFTENFISYLKAYNYYSTHNIENIEISTDSYMPVIDKFDMKFDSSASDNIRSIWAYTTALTKTSDYFGCEKPGIMIFDEPAQHSIGAADLKAFLDSIIELNQSNQTIVGITLNSSNVKEAINELPRERYKMIHLDGRAFKRV